MKRGIMATLLSGPFRKGQGPAREFPGWRFRSVALGLARLAHLATRFGAFAAHLAARLDGLVRRMLVTLDGARIASLGANLTGVGCQGAIAGTQPARHRA